MKHPHPSVWPLYGIPQIKQSHSSTWRNLIPRGTGPVIMACDLPSKEIQLSSRRTFSSFPLQPCSSIFLHFEGTSLLKSKIEWFAGDLSDASVLEFLPLGRMLEKDSPGNWCSAESYLKWHLYWFIDILLRTVMASLVNHLNSSILVCT